MLIIIERTLIADTAFSAMQRSMHTLPRGQFKLYKRIVRILHMPNL